MPLGNCLQRLLAMDFDFHDLCTFCQGTFLLNCQREVWNRPPWEINNVSHCISPGSRHMISILVGKGMQFSLQHSDLELRNLQPSSPLHFTCLLCNMLAAKECIPNLARLFSPLSIHGHLEKWKWLIIVDAIKLLKAILHAFHRRITKQFDPGTRQQTTHRLVLLSLIKVTFSSSNFTRSLATWNKY